MKYLCCFIRTQILKRTSTKRIFSTIRHAKSEQNPIQFIMARSNLLQKLDTYFRKNFPTIVYIIQRSEFEVVQTRIESESETKTHFLHRT